MMKTRRADIGKQRWLSHALMAALHMLRHGTATPETAADRGMAQVLATWENEGGGIKRGTYRAALKGWDAWTADLGAMLRAEMASPGFSERQTDDARREAESDAEWKRLAAITHARWDREDGRAA